MPPKHPQPCDCCDPAPPPCTCLDSKKSYEGTYASLNFSGGPASSGPYTATTKHLWEVCNSLGTWPNYSPNPMEETYSFPGIPNDSQSIDYDNEFCYVDLGQTVCSPRYADSNGYAVCINCGDGSFAAIGGDLGLSAVDSNCPNQGYDGFPRKLILSASGYLEFWCDPAVGDYNFRIGYSILHRLRIFPDPRYGLGGTCFSAYDPSTVIAANQDSSFTTQISRTRWMCTRNDSKAFLRIDRLETDYTVHAWGWADSIDGDDSVDVWSLPYNPLGWLQGSFALV